MDQQRQARARKGWQSCAQLLLCDHGEAVDAGMNEKTFEAGDTRGCEGFEGGRIVGDNSAPSHPIDTTAAARRCTLLLESGDGGRGGETIQRHVDKERVAPCSRGARGCLKAFPVGAARIVDMDMRIDEAWENGGVAEIANCGEGGNLLRGDNVADVFAFDEKRGGAHARGRDDATR